MPPMLRMQTFVVLLDVLFMSYYVWLMPVWDRFKNKFPFFAYEYKIVETPDFSQFILRSLFVALSKVSFKQASWTCRDLRS